MVCERTNASADAAVAVRRGGDFFGAYQRKAYRPAVAVPVIYRRAFGHGLHLDRGRGLVLRFNGSAVARQYRHRIKIHVRKRANLCLRDECEANCLIFVSRTLMAHFPSAPRLMTEVPQVGQNCDRLNYIPLRLSLSLTDAPCVPACPCQSGSSLGCCFRRPSQQSGLVRLPERPTYSHSIKPKIILV